MTVSSACSTVVGVCPASRPRRSSCRRGSAFPRRRSDVGQTSPLSLLTTIPWHVGRSPSRGNRRWRSREALPKWHAGAAAAALHAAGERPLAESGVSSRGRCAHGVRQPTSLCRVAAHPRTCRWRPPSTCGRTANVSSRPSRPSSHPRRVDTPDDLECRREVARPIRQLLLALRRVSPSMRNLSLGAHARIAGGRRLRERACHSPVLVYPEPNLVAADKAQSGIFVSNLHRCWGKE